MVSLANGEVIRMDDLRVGQLVQLTDPAGVQGTSIFVGWKNSDHDRFFIIKFLSYFFYFLLIIFKIVVI